MPAPVHFPPRFVRLAETGRPAIQLRIDGASASALEGDTVLVALLSQGQRVRDSEFGDGVRAGFCLMGACQECWVAIDGAPVRACGTLIAAGMRVATHRRSAGG